MWSAIFIDRTAVELDAYMRSPFIEGIVASFRSALPLPQTCAIHPEKYVQVFCPACDKSACDQCWTWVAYYFHCTFIALWRYHVRFCVVNMMYLLYCSIMVFVSFFLFLVINTRTTWLPQFRRTPSLNTPIPLWITTTPCTVALTRRSVISQLQSDISATFLHRCLNTLCCYF